MKIKDWDEAHGLVREYRRLSNEIEIVGQSNALGVTIQGKYQDEPLLVEVRPIVLAFLEQQQQDIRSKLVTLGLYDFGE